MEIFKIGFLSKQDGKKHQSNEVFSIYGLSPTICAGCGIKYWINVLELNKLSKEQEKVFMNDMNVNFLGSLYGHGPSFAGATFDTNCLCPTLTTMQGGGREPHIMEIKKIGGFEENSSQRRKVFDTDGISPTMQSAMGTGGGNIPYVIDSQIVAQRGRNPKYPNSRIAGLHTEQRLEINNENISNCITTVQKDNLVMETEIIAIDEQNLNCKTDCFGTLTTDGSSPKHNNRVCEVDKLNIKQATKEGSIPCEIGGVFDDSYPKSNTRRGRVQEDGTVCPTITAQNQEIYHLEKCNCNEPGAVLVYLPENDNYYMIRIRKLTPRECGRLMAVSDEDISKMLSVNSNSQCYKQFGNSIVVDVMCSMFKNLYK